MSEEDYRIIENSNIVDSIVRVFKKDKSYNTAFFPNDISYDWNEDNLGPIVIPKKGFNIDLNLKNLPLYKKIIRDYEKNLIDVKNGELVTRGKI